MTRLPEREPPGLPRGLRDVTFPAWDQFLSDLIGSECVSQWRPAKVQITQTSKIQRPFPCLTLLESLCQGRIPASRSVPVPLTGTVSLSVSRPFFLPPPLPSCPLGSVRQGLALLGGVGSSHYLAQCSMPTLAGPMGLSNSGLARQLPEPRPIFHHAFIFKLMRTLTRRCV